MACRPVDGVRRVSFVPTESVPLVDAIGQVHTRATAPRIVCLVPSITELLVDLGLAHALVGRTGFCIHPRDIVRRIPKVGGTKDVRIDRVRALAPSHVIVNVEENRKDTVDALREFVPHVVVTWPRAPEDNLELYSLMGQIFRREDAARALATRFEAALARARNRSADRARQSVVYLIWREPWMTVARDTYISRTLALFGWDTTPEDSTVPYPPIDLDPTLGNRVAGVMLSSEPFRFTAKHVEEVATRCGIDPRRVMLVDGEATSWYGSRAIEGLGYLARLRATWPCGGRPLDPIDPIDPIEPVEPLKPIDPMPTHPGSG